MGWALCRGMDTSSPPSPAGGNGDVDSELSEVQTPIPWCRGGDRDINTEQRAAGLHYPAKQPKLIPLFAVGRESGHLSQGTVSPNSSTPSWGQDRFGVWLGVDAAARCCSAACDRKDLNPAQGISCASAFVLPRQKVTLLLFLLKSWRVWEEVPVGLG